MDKPNVSPNHRRRVYFDIETNGLLDLGPDLLKLWCVTAIDMDTDEELYYGPPVPPEHHLATALLSNPTGTAEEGARMVMEADLAVAHNGIGYDYLALAMILPWFKRPTKAWDSFVMAKAVWPADLLMGPDYKRFKAGTMPWSLVKRHSLKAWAVRLGDYKDDYDGDRDKYPDDGTEETRKLRYSKRWAEPNPYMLSYAMQDCRPGLKLWRLIERRVGWTPPLERDQLVWPELVFEVEHEVARIIAQQELTGVNFDRVRAEALAAELANEKARLEHALIATFGTWWAHGPVRVQGAPVQRKRTEFPDVCTRRFSDKTGKELAPQVGPPEETYVEGAEFTPVSHTTFQPSSRDHLGQRLQAVFGWKPKKFGKDGKPSVDESTLEEIPEAVMPETTRRLIIDYFVVNKTLGTLTLGRKAWIRLADNSKDGRLHGRMDTLGAITGRGTHMDPNLSGTPSVLKEKAPGSTEEAVVKGLRGRYGWECRELFIADEGEELTGVDASSLELIDLGHYMHPLDGGKFSARVCDPTRDAHKEHAELADLTRGDAKTAIYLIVYGGGAYKFSLSLTVAPEEIPALLGYKGLNALLRNLEKRFDAEFVSKMDDAQRAKLAKARIIIVKIEKGIEGIADLKKDVTKEAGRGWLKGMDGRKVHVRKDYAGLNTLLQSAGAQTCKLWMMLTHRKLAARGLIDGVDFKQVLWVHDEFQFTHRPGLGPIIAEVAKEAIRETGDILGLRGVYRGEAKTGRNWAECH